MTDRRFKATNLQAILEEQERSIRWLTSKVNAANVSVSNSLMWYVATGQRTCGEQVGRTVAEILKVPFFLLFESTDVDSESRQVEQVA